MNKSAKEKKYDNETAIYFFGKTSTEKPTSSVRHKDNKKEDSKVVAGGENANPELCD